jgi:hypothetical protein
MEIEVMVVVAVVAVVDIVVVVDDMVVAVADSMVELVPVSAPAPVPERDVVVVIEMMVHWLPGAYR